jgi:hypothetical protein
VFHLERAFDRVPLYLWASGVSSNSSVAAVALDARM